MGSFSYLSRLLLLSDRRLVSALADVLMQFLCLARRFGLQLSPENIPAGLILAYGLVALSLGGISFYEGTVRGLPHGSRAMRLMPMAMASAPVKLRGQPVHRADDDLTQPGAFDRQPFVEGRVAQRESVE